MSHILDDLSLVSAITCNNRDCSNQGKNFFIYCYTLEDMGYAQSCYDEFADSDCPCCGCTGVFNPPYNFFFEFRTDNKNLVVQFDDDALDVLTSILRNMQEDFNQSTKIFLASDQAFGIADKFHVVTDFTVQNTDGSFSVIPAYPFDERNKVIIAGPQSIQLQVDVKRKDDPEAQPVTITSRSYSLSELMLLRQANSFCKKPRLVVEDETEDDTVLPE